MEDYGAVSPPPPRSADAQHRLDQISKRRRHRAQVVLALVLILGITFVTLQTENIVSSWIRPASTRYTKFNGDFDTISPFAKKKVQLAIICVIDGQCEDIYSHQDQCKFVLKRCQESEVGMIHYLKFYFCTLGNVRPVAFIIMVRILRQPSF